MAHVTGMHDERGTSRERIDLGRRKAEAADNVRVGGLIEAEVRVADLDECEPVRLGGSQGTVAGIANRAWNASQHCPHDCGPAPVGKTTQHLAASWIGRAQFARLVLHEMAPCVTGWIARAPLTVWGMRLFHMQAFGNKPAASPVLRGTSGVACRHRTHLTAKSFRT